MLDRTSEDLPAALLDDYLALLPRDGRTAVPATAIRGRSLAARQLLARAALRDAATLDDLLGMARTGVPEWLRRMAEVRPNVLSGLAQTLAMQDMLVEDRGDALAVYDLIRRALGAIALSSGHQGLHAQLSLLTDGPEKARELLSVYSAMPEQIRRDLELDLTNPFTGAAGLSVQVWLARFQQLLPEPGPALLADHRLLPFDRLTAPPVSQVEAPERISVIITAYRPDEGLITAVRSILAQSWVNVEIVIVDDASPASFDEMLDRAAGLGRRIRVVRQSVNAGTYAARNAGLDASEGEFVTFQDSDDWSHPRRLELQVQPLLDDRTVVATTSDGLAVTEQLMLTRPGVRSGRFNPSSLMFRRATVPARIGYFDDVRKAADSEYIGRIRAAFGEQAISHVGDEKLALIRLSQNSLSRSEIRAFWMHPARVAYSSAYLHWHERIAAGTADPYRPRDGADRPFAAPPHLRHAPGPEQPVRRFDVVVVGDWRFRQSTQESVLDEIAAMVDAGLAVAVAHVESYRVLSRRRYPLNAGLQQLINSGRVEQVSLGERVETALVLVRQAEVLQFASDDACRIQAAKAVIVADRAPERGDGRDRRYLAASAGAAVRRLFGVDPLWCPQDAGIRTALLSHDSTLACTAWDLPAIVAGTGWAAPRGGSRPVAGTDLSDHGVGKTDVTDALAVYEGLTVADVRLRLPDWQRSRSVPRSAAWLVYEATDLTARTFLHQLDFYLHFPHPLAPEAHSRPALLAAALGCVVVMPERFAGSYGDAAVYCEPGEAGELIRRYRRDRDLFAEQGRRAREVVAKAHHNQLYVDRITGLIGTLAPVAPHQRVALALRP